MKIFCNECYQPLVVNDYDIGYYVDRCDCMKKADDEEIEDAYNNGHCDGFDEGYAEGYKVDPEGENK